MLQDAVQLEITGEGEFVRLAGTVTKFAGNRSFAGSFPGMPIRKYSFCVIETRQCANRVTGVGPDTVFSNATNIDRDAHIVV